MTELDIEIDKKTYDSIISRMIDIRNPVVIYQSGALYGSIVTANIIKNSSKEINIHTSSFADKIIFNKDSLQLFDDFLFDDGNLNIGFYDFNENTINQDFKSLVLKYREKIRIKSLTTEVHRNFIIGDDNMYRLEYDVRQNSAEFSFNNRNKVNILKSQLNSSLDGNDINFNQIGLVQAQLNLDGLSIDFQDSHSEEDHENLSQIANREDAKETVVNIFIPQDYDKMDKAEQIYFLKEIQKFLKSQNNIKIVTKPNQ